MPDRLESGAKVCPYCSYGLSADGVCTSCGQRLDPGDWPVEAAYLPDGLQAIAEGNAVRYALPVGQEALHAQLSANPHLPHDIPYQDPLWVGDTLQDAIRLERSGAVRAVFYRNRRSHECWVLDQSRFASVRVNGKFVRNARLVANDVIDIAGVCLSFDGGSIGRQEDVSEGVILSAHGAGVAVPWDEADRYMHLPMREEAPRGTEPRTAGARAARYTGTREEEEALRAIF